MVAINSLVKILTYTIGLCGIIPLFPWLALFPKTALVVGVAIGIWQDRRGSWSLKPWLQSAVIVPFFLYYAAKFSRASPVDPVISVLAIMLAFRLGGDKSGRHCLQIYALSMFCLAASSLFDLSPVFLIYLGFLLFMTAIALVLLAFKSQNDGMRVTRRELRLILISGLLMPALTVPLLLMFFPVMPRTQMPLWHFLSPPPSRSGGYSETVEPGSQNSVNESRVLAFRAEMQRQPLTRLYWRGTVFNTTDGNRWTRNSKIPSELVRFSGKKVRQTIYPEASVSRALIALDRSAALDLKLVSRAPDGVMELSRYFGRRLNYIADSQPDGVIAQSNAVNRQFYLQLPNRLPQRITMLAAEIGRSGDDRAKVDRLESYFRNGEYRYSTKNLATGDKALETFVFDRKQGHCEFFASSFALLLRAAGVPCRLVGGFLGGEYNELGGYYIVTDDKAHVWVEAYIDGSGWIRIDPSSFASNAGEVWAAQGSPGLMLRIALTVDSFNYMWNRSVITYDFEQQMKVATEISSRFDAISPSRAYSRLLPFVSGIIMLVVAIYTARQTSMFSSREERIMRSFLRKYKNEFGISAEGGCDRGLFEMAEAAGNRHVSDFVSIYAGAVYCDRRLTDEEYRRLCRILKEIKGVESKTP